MTKKKLAKLITDISTPAVVGGLFLTVAFYKLSPSIDIFTRTISTLLIVGIALPVAFTLLLVKKKVVTNFHLKVRKERLYPLLFALLSGFLAILIVRFFGAPQKINEIMMVFYSMALGFSLITIKYKISGHAFVFTTSILLSAFYLNMNILFLLPLLVPVGWSRIYLKEHSFKEFLVGFLYAVASFYILNLLIL